MTARISVIALFVAPLLLATPQALAGRPVGTFAGGQFASQAAPFVAPARPFFVRPRVFFVRPFFAGRRVVPAARPIILQPPVFAPPRPVFLTPPFVGSASVFAEPAARMAQPFR